MVSAELVKKLREKTGAGMMACKEALEAAEGDFEEAIQWLRKKGMASAAKKAGRATQEGLIGALAEDNFGVALEINCETDFVARNEQFLSFAKELLAVAFANHVTSLEELEKCSFSKKNVTAKEAITEAVSKLGENIVLRRIGALSVSPGRVVSYIHNAREPALGRSRCWLLWNLLLLLRFWISLERKLLCMLRHCGLRIFRLLMFLSMCFKKKEIF